MYPHSALRCFILSLLTFENIGSHALFADTLASKEYALKRNATSRLMAVVEHHRSEETGLENLFIHFFRRTHHARTEKEVRREGPGFCDQTIVASGNFLNNGRDQLLVWMVHGGTVGGVFDFDGERVITRYSVEEHPGRMWIYPITSRGRCLIAEESATADFSEPGFAMQRKGDNVTAQLRRWDGTGWEPVRFRFVKGKPVPTGF